MQYDNKQYVYPERKKSGCLENAVKIGVGFILGVVCSFLFMGMFYIFIMEPNNNILDGDDERTSLYDDSNRSVEYFQVRSKKGKATIHIGMPKDSVILLLGQPTEFSLTEYVDEITYRYGAYDMNSLRIDFEKGKVRSVYQY